MLNLCLWVFVSEHAALSGTFTELSLLWVNYIGTYQEYKVEVACYSFKYMLIFNIWQFQTYTQCVLIKLNTTLSLRQTPPTSHHHFSLLITSNLFSKPGSLISAACTCMGHAFWVSYMGWDLNRSWLFWERDSLCIPGWPWTWDSPD